MLAEVKMTKLTNIAKSLNESRDALTEKIKQHEEAISKLNLGVEAIVPASKGFFGYGRIDKKWCFFYQEGDGRKIPVIHSATKVRIEFLHHLQELIDALYLNTEEILSSTYKAAKLAREMMDAIKEAE
jgi:hypothetical protein